MVLEVAGSRPVFHPIKPFDFSKGFLLPRNLFLEPNLLENLWSRDRTIPYPLLRVEFVDGVEQIKGTTFSMHDIINLRDINAFDFGLVVCMRRLPHNTPPYILEGKIKQDDTVPKSL